MISSFLTCENIMGLVIASCFSDSGVPCTNLRGGMHEITFWGLGRVPLVEKYHIVGGRKIGNL